MKKIAKFFASVKKEMAKVKWPNKKELTVYSIATIAFICIFGIFFTSIDLILAGIRMLVK